MPVQFTTLAYPKIMYRWIIKALCDADTAYSPASLAEFAVKRRLLRQEHAARFYLMTGLLMEHANISAEALIKPDGLPIEAWSSYTWKQVLSQIAPPTPRPLQFQFLIERAIDGEKHHASSLSWLITERDIGVHDLSFVNLEVARFSAKRSLARIRQNRITIEAVEMRGIQSGKRNFTVQYSAFDAAIWKSALLLPGYYGLHTSRKHV